MSDLEAEHQKELGNQAFQNANYSQAIDHYTEAIRLNPKQVTYYCNRSASFAKTKVYYHAMEDALKCVDMSPSFVKGYYRLAIAFDGLNFLKFAIISLQNALKYEPKNSDILTKFQEIYWKLVHQRNVIGKELLRSCRLSQWSFIPTLFCRSTIIRISDRDINDPYYYDDYASPRYNHALPGEADLELRCPETNMTPLLLAVSRGDSSTISLLLFLGACADLAMPVAIAFLQPNSIRSLLLNGYSIDRDAFSYVVASNPYNMYNNFSLASPPTEVPPPLQTVPLGRVVAIPEFSDLIYSEHQPDQIIDALELLIANGADVNQKFLKGYKNCVPQMGSILESVWCFVFPCHQRDWFPVAHFLVRSGAKIEDWKYDFEEIDEEEEYLKAQLIRESKWYRRQAFLMVLSGDGMAVTVQELQAPIAKIVHLREIIEWIVSFL